MHRYNHLLCGLGVTLFAPAAASSVPAFGPWQKNQVNTSICTWEQPRAALIRDTVYLDGGLISWSPGLSSGEYGLPQNFENDLGIILTYNLSEAFSPSTNLTSLLLKQSLQKTRGGESSDDETPNYTDGGMLANEFSFFLYGGSAFVISTDDAPDADAVLGYEVYSQEPGQTMFSPGFQDTKLPSDITRYLTYGGAVNAPSENTSWYFSGMTAPGGGPIFEDPPNNSEYAHVVSKSFLTLDLSVQFAQTWTNTTLPSEIPGRANPEVVWVPVGENGILVAIGGVIYPEWANTTEESQNPTESEKESPTFMQVIDVYDVSKDAWYKQPTTNSPGTRTRGCAVVAHASDLSSFNIYYYGGFDGIHVESAFDDDVWVLSLPSFTWTQINGGAPLHARAGHKCFMPYPDQMMAFGGYTPRAGVAQDCLDGGPVVIFNVTSGEWMDSYDPTKYGKYGVPDKVQSVIGGDAAGAATMTKPSDGWATSALGDVFATSYDMSKITTYGPYTPAPTPTSRPNLPSSGGGSSGGGSGLPSWVAPFLGVVLGVLALTAAIVLYCLWRKRGIFKPRYSEAGTEDAGVRILSWMRGQGIEKDVATTTTDEPPPPLSPGITDSHTVGSTPSGVPTYTRYEMADTSIVELSDTSPRPELHDTGLSPIDVIQKHSHFGSSRSDPSQSMLSTSIGEFSAGSVSHSSGMANTPPPADGRAESPSYMHGAEGASRQVGSGVSRRDAAHLRQDSDGSISLTGMHHDERPHGPRTVSLQSEPQASPISPPTAVEAPPEDYLGGNLTVSPIRRSVFRESEEDLGTQH